MFKKEEIEGEGSSLSEAIEVTLGKATEISGFDMNYDFEIKKITGQYIGLTGKVHFKVTLLVTTHCL